MGKIHDQMRARTNGGGPRIRTGQGVGMVAGGNGGCAPLATQPQSWGAACPPGYCTADELARNLNRSFAGERYPCRELPYTLVAVADAGGVATFKENSRVTMCPTRVILSLDDEVAVPNDALLTSFEIGNQNQIIGDPLQILQFNPFSYAAIPFVTDCIKAGLPFSATITGLTADNVAYLTLIGPTIG